VLGEDASTDRTREIVLELEKNHPDKIRVLLRDRDEAERDRASGIPGKTEICERPASMSRKIHSAAGR